MGISRGTWVRTAWKQGSKCPSNKTSLYRLFTLFIPRFFLPVSHSFPLHSVPLVGSAREGKRKIKTEPTKGKGNRWLRLTAGHRPTREGGGRWKRMGGRVWRALNFDLTLSVMIGTIATSKWHDNINLPSILMSPRQVKQLFNFWKACVAWA